MKHEYFCILCNETHDNKSDFKHTCHEDYINGRYVQNKWERFFRKLLSLDIEYFLAFSGAIAINAIIISHFNYAFHELLIQSIGVGLIFPRLLRKEFK